MHIETIIVGTPQYDGETSGLMIAVTLKENVKKDELYIKIIQDDVEWELEGECKDAQDAYGHEEDSISSSPELNGIVGHHWHFDIKGLRPNVPFSYEIMDRKREPVYVSKVFNGNGHPIHTPVKLISPPLPGQRSEYKLVFSADQEVMDAIQTFELDNKVAKKLGLNLDQRNETKEIYDAIEREKMDLFIHGGDIFFGENLIPYERVKKLEKFRARISEDFHEVVRDALSKTISLRALDDHDFGANGASAQMFNEDRNAMMNAINAFNEFWPVNSHTEDAHRGLYYDTRYGDIQIWVVNNRLYHFDGQSLLGDAQKTWLANGLRESDAPVKLVVTPLPFVMGKNPEEDYRSKPEEFNELLQLFGETGVSAIFTADSHNYSRTDITMKLNGQNVTIPQFLVGMLGGKPQKVNDKERNQIPRPLVPENFEEVYDNSVVQAYYTPMKKAAEKNIIFNDKNLRAFKEGKWVGKHTSKGHYGYLQVQINSKKGEFLTSFKSMRTKAPGDGREAFKDEAIYPIRKKMGS